MSIILTYRNEYNNISVAKLANFNDARVFIAEYELEGKLIKIKDTSWNPAIVFKFTEEENENH